MLIQTILTVVVYDLNCSRVNSKVYSVICRRQNNRERFTIFMDLIIDCCNISTNTGDPHIKNQLVRNWNSILGSCVQNVNSNVTNTKMIMFTLSCSISSVDINGNCYSINSTRDNCTYSSSFTFHYNIT